MPEVSARWKGEDGIERNIVFLVHAETVELEVNAWKDDQINRKRHWGNFRVAILTHQCDNANFDTALAALLEFAYKTISTVSIDQLTKVSDLPLATN
ncbi:MAG: hypothetical protein HYT22_02485 [Candidatus Niyogibacteria bacterium]|nr:hypothetical protein [Candidatus Niyogibacteria bacterium]